MPLGLASGFAGGWVDAAITRVFDTLFAFPGILLGIGLMAVLGASLTNVVIAVAIINVPTLGRLIRGAVIAQRGEDYVEAARSIGATPVWVATRHVVPNIVPPLLVQVTLVMTDAVLLEAAFSFLGLGSRPPTPSWGTMLSEGRSFLGTAWWLGVFPGLTITVMVLGLNALGDALRIALNPRRR
jgi:peptide/nickel transport system permease protein